MASVEPIQSKEQSTTMVPPHISGVALARNTAFNFAGQILPLLAGVALIPYIVRGLGTDRFGLLGIIWVIFGYFSLMDLGIGRATTKFLAEWLAKGETEKISEMVWSSVLLQLLLGVVGGAIIALLAPFFVERVLKTPAGLVDEARTAFYILAAAMPTVLTINGLRAVLEGCHRFDIANLLRIPANVLAFAIPAVAIVSGLKLPGIVLWMTIFRFGFTVAHGFCCVRILPSLKVRPKLRPGTLVPLLSFGGWVTASNLVNPVLVSMDRFLIGSMLSVAMVGFYTAPFEAATKLWMIPASLMTTVYPACSALGMGQKENLQTLYSRSIKYIFCVLAPVSLILVLFAKPIIKVWLGQDFVDKSAVPLQILSVGVFINCFAHVPYCFMQALGRPDTAAKLFLCELIPYGLMAWWMIGRYGIAGAAAAWSIRTAIEVFLLLWLTGRVFNLSAVRVLDRKMWTAIGALCATGVGAFVTNYFLQSTVWLDVMLCIAWMAAFGLAVWKWVLDGSDRTSMLGVIGPLRNLFGRRFGSAEAD